MKGLNGWVALALGVGLVGSAAAADILDLPGYAPIVMGGSTNVFCRTENGRATGVIDNSRAKTPLHLYAHMSTLKLNERMFYAGYDTTRNVFLGPFAGYFPCTVAPGEVRHFQLATLAVDRPTLLSVSTGAAAAMEGVSGESWTNGSYSATLRTAAGKWVEVRFALPNGWRLAAAAPADAQVKAEGRFARVSFKAEGEATVLRLTASASRLRLISSFTDHAVLQRGRPVVVSGFAAPLARVRVEFGELAAEGVAGPDGRWEATLPAMAASKLPRTLAVSAGDEQLVLNDILVGEVWVASGQSNMEMPLWHHERKRFRDKLGGLVSQWCHNPNLRVMMTYPEVGVSGRPRPDYPAANWSVPTAEYLADNKYSALAYYFARELQATLDVPVGIIGAWWGGTCLRSWVPDSGWQAVAAEPHVATNLLPGIEERLSRHDRGDVRRWPKYAGDIYNEQVAALAPYTIRGMIWYQGCSDIDENHFGVIPYSQGMRALAAGWRHEFRDPVLPLLFVELAPFSYPWLKLTRGDARLAELCDEQQRFAAADANAHLACISDVGDVNDIHPCRKLEVALRLAGLAYESVDGLPVKADAPLARAAKLVAPGKVEVTLDHAEGLYRWMNEVSLWTERQHETSPVRFVAADGRMVDCESEIVDGKLVVTSAEVLKPAFVTYLREATDESNIFNAATLPLGTFQLPVGE